MQPIALTQPECAPEARSPAHRLGTAIARCWYQHRARRQRIATMRTLQALDDRTLHDIGIDRSEISSIARAPRGDRWPVHRFQSPFKS